MPFSEHYQEAAYRHFHDAETLLDLCRHEAAGYHFGFAAECALKAALKRANVPSLGLKRSLDPMWAHFGRKGSIKAKMQRLSIGGRWGAALLTLSNDIAFMAGWDTSMRYAPDGSVTASSCNSWQADATRAIVDLGI